MRKLRLNEADVLAHTSTVSEKSRVDNRRGKEERRELERPLSFESQVC